MTADDIEVVGEAATGVDAVELAVRLAPDLVLMDLRMPGIDGDEATSRILAALPATKVMILTTYDSDDSILSAIEAGARGYLLKAAPAGGDPRRRPRGRPRRDGARAEHRRAARRQGAGRPHRG